MRHTKTKPAIFAIVTSRIQGHQHGPLEHLFDLDEIEFMLVEVREALPFVPLEVHATECSYSM